MKIVYVSNDEYARHLGVSMCSLFDSNQGAEEIQVYVLSIGIGADSRRKLEELAVRYGRELIYVEMEDLKDRIPFSVDTGRFDISTLGRLFMGEALPREVERCIYLDCDTAVIRSLDRLWQADLGKAVIGAAQEPTIYRKVKETIGLKEDEPYYNAGMLLVDLKAWRQAQTGRRLMEFYAERGGRLLANDQDVLNGTLKGSIRTLPPKYNFFPNYRYFSYEALVNYAPVYREVTKKQFEAAKRRPVIIHYMGDERPWIAGNLNHYRRAYEKYLARTGWAGALKTPGKRLYMLAYHGMDYLTAICPRARFAIGRRLGVKLMEDQMRQNQDSGENAAGKNHPEKENMPE